MDGPTIWHVALGGVMGLIAWGIVLWVTRRPRKGDLTAPVDEILERVERIELAIQQIQDGQARHSAELVELARLTKQGQGVLFRMIQQMEKKPSEAAQ